jgi:hypothetical protein
LIGAYKSGIKAHPQIDVKSMGMKVIKFEGVPIADCVFMKVDNIPDKLPSYISLSDFKFSI